MMTLFQGMMNNVLTSQATRTPAAAPTTTAAAALSSKMHLNDPDPFDGSPKNTETFINSCVNIFLAQPLLYADSESQVCFTLSFLKSGAIRWHDTMFCNIKNGA